MGDPAQSMDVFKDILVLFVNHVIMRMNIRDLVVIVVVHAKINIIFK